MPSVIVHLQNEDPVVGEMDELPKPIDYLITVKNPRKKDGKGFAILGCGRQSYHPSCISN